MPWPVYSTRFLKIAGTTTVYRYTVPLGHVAVVKNVLATNYQPSPYNVFGALAGANFLWQQLPASPYTFSFTCHAVAYGGEEISAGTGNANMSVIVSGYLLTESATQPQLLVAQEATTLEELGMQHLEAHGFGADPVG